MLADTNTFILLNSAFLPSSFAMYFIMLGWSYAIESATNANKARTIKAATAFGAAVILGWPFTAVLVLPFVLEELLLSGRDFSLNIPKRIATLAQAAVPSLGLLVGQATKCLCMYAMYTYMMCIASNTGLRLRCRLLRLRQAHLRPLEHHRI